MQAARSGADTHNNQLGLLVGEERLLLSLQEAGEIVAVDSITQVPLTQDWYLGLTNIRGTLISVVDFACFQGHPMTVIDKDARIISFSTTLAFNSALLVRRVLGLRNVDEMTLQSVPRMIGRDILNDHEAAALAETSPARYMDSESQLWTELKLTQLIRDPRFLHVGI
ncbi:twitching motility protein PilI [Glaciimonas sp. PCH181]|nr:twitching motility protein PilI [Glaciimonas sp. PCH181]